MIWSFDSKKDCSVSHEEHPLRSTWNESRVKTTKQGQQNGTGATHGVEWMPQYRQKNETKPCPLKKKCRKEFRSSVSQTNCQAIGERENRPGVKRLGDQMFSYVQCGQVVEMESLRSSHWWQRWWPPGNSGIVVVRHCKNWNPHDQRKIRKARATPISSVVHPHRKCPWLWHTLGS